MSVIAYLPDDSDSTVQGNLIANGNRTLFNVFTGSSQTEIYLARCAAPCRRFVTQRIFSGGPCVTVGHPYPVVALDHAGGLHVAFSDGRTVFLMSSADGGDTWKDPVPVNDPSNPATSSATTPWLLAGDSGRIGLTWLNAKGDVYYAFTSDAFASLPIFSYVRIGNAQPNANLPAAAVDPTGNANIVFGHTRLSRQLAGERLFFGPLINATGNLQTKTGIKRISFSVRRDYSGYLTYVDEQRRLSLKSVHFTAFRMLDQRIVFTGHGELQDGKGVTFTLVASNPGTVHPDVSISLSNGYLANGMLQSTPFLEAKVQKVDRRIR